jgi:hypothetical protein
LPQPTKKSGMQKVIAKTSNQEKRKKTWVERLQKSLSIHIGGVPSSLPIVLSKVGSSKRVQVEEELNGIQLARAKKN